MAREHLARPGPLAKVLVEGFGVSPGRERSTELTSRARSNAQPNGCRLAHIEACQALDFATIKSQVPAPWGDWL